MSYGALVEIIFNLNIDFLSNLQSLIATLDFLCQVSMSWAAGVVVKCTNRIIRMMRMPPGRIMWLWLQSGAQYRANH